MLCGKGIAKKITKFEDREIKNISLSKNDTQPEKSDLYKTI